MLIPYFIGQIYLLILVTEIDMLWLILNPSNQIPMRQVRPPMPRAVIVAATELAATSRVGQPFPRELGGCKPGPSKQEISYKLATSETAA